MALFENILFFIWQWFNYHATFSNWYSFLYQLKQKLKGKSNQKYLLIVIGQDLVKTYLCAESKSEELSNSPNMAQSRRVIKLDLAAMSQLLAFDEVSKIFAKLWLNWKLQTRKFLQFDHQVYQSMLKADHHTVRYLLFYLNF